MAKQRSDGDGSVYPRHKAGCEKPVDAKGKPRCGCPWQAALVVGYKRNAAGNVVPDRRKVTGKTRADALANLRELREDITANDLPASGKVLTVEQWMNYWFTRIAPRRCRPLTLQGYRAKVDYINALLGHHRLDRLTPEHIDDAWDYLLEQGHPIAEKAHARDPKTGKPAPTPLSANTVHQTHRILARALKVAVQRKKLRHNPAGADSMDAPPKVDKDIEVMTSAEAAASLAAAEGQWNGARWRVALALGLRQGEALGLRWSDVDLDAGTLHVRQSLMRVTGKGIMFGEPKSANSKRPLAIPATLLGPLKAHRKQQTEARLAAGDRWVDSGLMFTLEDGRPIDPSVDFRRWRKLLVAAGVKHYRLHDARHSAATMLLAQGVDIRVAMKVLGHANLATTMRYQHVVDQLLVDAAAKIDGAFGG